MKSDMKTLRQETKQSLQKSVDKTYDKLMKISRESALDTKVKKSARELRKDLARQLTVLKEKTNEDKESK